MKNSTFKNMVLSAATSILFATINDQTNGQGNALWKPLGKDTVVTTREVLAKRSVTALSMHAKDFLSVGDSTLWFVPFGTADHIRSDLGQIAVMEGDNTAFSSNIKVGIGLTNPNNTIQVKDLINFKNSSSSTFLSGGFTKTIFSKYFCWLG